MLPATMPDDTGRREMLARLDAGRRIGIAIRQERSAGLIRAVLQVAADDAGTIGIRALWIGRTVWRATLSNAL